MKNDGNALVKVLLLFRLLILLDFFSSPFDKQKGFPESIIEQPIEVAFLGILFAVPVEGLAHEREGKLIILSFEINLKLSIKKGVGRGFTFILN